MHDGKTQKVELDLSEQRGTFLASHCATLIMVSGSVAGTEWTLEGARSIAGRSDKAAIELEDRSVSHEHAAFELAEDGFRVRDLASTNGVMVNGKTILSSALQHGDRVQLGDCEFQYVVEDRPGQSTAWCVEDDA